jgi:tetratricopeptide (TPR) repeat protein
MKIIITLSILLLIGIKGNSQSANLDYEKTLNLAISLLDNNQLTKSRNELVKLIDDYHQSEIQFSKDLYLGQSMTETQLDKFVQKSVYAQKANFYLGQIALSSESPFDAITYFKASLELDSTDVNTLSGIGDGYLLTFKLPKAIEYYSYAISIKPNTYSYLKRASTLSKLREYKLAIDDLTKAIELTEDCFVCFQNRGYTLLLNGQYKESIKDFDRVLSNDGEDSYALNNKGMALFKLGEAKKALELIDKALLIDKSNYYALRNKAIVFYTQGKKEFACKEINNAISGGLDTRYDKELVDLLNSCK